jgi:radical SAM protein with 4Fe4S-binding SPASM domain
MKEIKSIQIQTIDYCNRKCAWCPNSKMDKSPKDLMPFMVMDRILDELKRLNYEGIFHPFLMAEPLCDWRIVSFIKEIRNRFPDNFIRITTNGDMLEDPVDVALLLDSGLNKIHISHYEKKIGICEDVVFGKRVTHVGIDAMLPTFNNRAGNIEIEGSVVGPEKVKTCSYVLEKMCITIKGDVILCCADYHHEVIMGNIITTPLDEIWEFGRYKHYRKFHKEGKGKQLLLCERCNRI